MYDPFDCFIISKKQVYSSSSAADVPTVCDEVRHHHYLFSVCVVVNVCVMIQFIYLRIFTVF